MLAKLLTNTVLIAGMAIGAALYLDYKEKSEDKTAPQAALQDNMNSVQNTAVKEKKKPVTQSASVVSIPKDTRS